MPDAQADLFREGRAERRQSEEDRTTEDPDEQNVRDAKRPGHRLYAPVLVYIDFLIIHYCIQAA